MMMALAVALSFGLSQQEAQAQRVSPAMVSLSMQRRGVPTRPRLAPRRINERNRRLHYTIKASYPQLVGATDESAVGFNRAVRDLITKEVNDFKKDFAPPDRSVPKEMRESDFDAAYEVDYSSADLISVSFSFSVYNAGAAHPNHYSMTLNYDLGAGRTLKLSDLFRPRSNYLQAISTYVVKELKKKLGPEVDSEWVERGAAPDSENYKSWSITRRGLSVTFDPYQVASYAEGEHVVVVPYAALRNLLNTDSPVGALAGR
jgi:hypothetical protein